MKYGSKLAVTEDGKVVFVTTLGGNHAVGIPRALTELLGWEPGDRIEVHPNMDLMTITLQLNCKKEDIR